MAKIYGYGRHSTATQSLTEAAQRSSVEAYAAAYLQCSQLDEWLYDAAVSGGTSMFERPEGRRLWAMAQPGDHIVIAKLDRAFRRTLDGLTILEMLEAKGVFFHCVQQKVDTFTAQGRAILTVLLAFAELEREQAAERTREALAVKRERGLPIGGAPPLGWKKVGRGKESRYVPDERERDQAYTIAGFRAAGWSYDKIVQAMRGKVRTSGNEWNRNTVRMAVKAVQRQFPKSQLASPSPAST
jgi:DNA invertase Pin-like site-specific DNA recombinase